MSIKVQCPNPTCGKVFSVKEDYAGRKAKCPGCSSPLIIPTPEGGGFDFGALTGGPSADPGNPFAELGAEPPSPASKSKPVKKPASVPTPDLGGKKGAPPAVSESDNPFAVMGAEPSPAPPGAVPRPVPPPAAVAPPVVVVDVLAEPAAMSVQAAPMVLPLPGPTAEADDFTDITEAATSAPSSGPEPWYYSFLAGYAKVLLFLGGLLALLFLVSGIVSTFSMSALTGGSPILAGIFLVLTLLTTAMFLLGVVIMVAFILLVVDSARNLREIRRLLRK